MGHRARELLVVAALAALFSLPIACGDVAQGPGPSASATAVRATLLESPQGGFSIKYPADFVKVEPDVSGQPGLIYQVLLADPTGAKSGDTTLDVLGVMVRQMSKAARPGDLKKHQSEFEGMAQQLIGAPDSLKVSGVQRSELAGRPALRVEYVYRINDADVAVVAYLVPAGRRVYWVTGQAGRSTWETSGRQIGAAMQTFALKQ